MCLAYLDRADATSKSYPYPESTLPLALLLPNPVTRSPALLVLRLVGFEPLLDPGGLNADEAENTSDKKFHP